MILTNKTYKDLNFNQMFNDVGIGMETNIDIRVPINGAGYIDSINSNFASSGPTTNNDTLYRNTFLIVSGKYLDMLEKINIKLRDPSVISLMNSTYHYKLVDLVLTILSYATTHGKNVLDWMVAKNILTAEDILPWNDVISLSAVAADYTTSFDSASSVWTVKIRDTLAVTLSKRYAKDFYDNNLFLFKTLNFQGYNLQVIDGIYQFGYLAWSLTDRDGDGDIKLDHLDKVDYIDGISVKLKIPNYF